MFFVVFCVFGLRRIEIESSGVVTNEHNKQYHFSASLVLLLVIPSTSVQPDGKRVTKEYVMLGGVSYSPNVM